MSTVVPNAKALFGKGKFSRVKDVSFHPWEDAFTARPPKSPGLLFVNWRPKNEPLGDVRLVVDAGGLFNYARQSGMIPAQG